MAVKKDCPAWVVKVQFEKTILWFNDTLTMVSIVWILTIWSAYVLLTATDWEL